MMGNDETRDSANEEKGYWAGKLETIGWALFFIWVGIAFLLKLGFGIGLLGVGIITLGGQIARTYYKLKIEAFWVVIGILFLLGGFWELFEPRLPLVPVVLIVAGLVMLLSIAWRKK